MPQKFFFAMDTLCVGYECFFQKFTTWQLLSLLISTASIVQILIFEFFFLNYFINTAPINRELFKKLFNNSALHRSSCLNPRGRLVCPRGVYWQSSNLSRSFGTSPISLTLSLYTECDVHSVIICKGFGSKQHTPLTRPFQGNHVSIMSVFEMDRM